jgi:hypothetical protein
LSPSPFSAHAACGCRGLTPTIEESPQIIGSEQLFSIQSGIPGGMIPAAFEAVRTHFSEVQGKVQAKNLLCFERYLPFLPVFVTVLLDMMEAMPENVALKLLHGCVIAVEHFDGYRFRNQSLAPSEQVTKSVVINNDQRMSEDLVGKL